MLYPAHSRVGTGNRVLRHSVPHFPPKSGGIACWVVELNAAFCLYARAKNESIKYFITSSGNLNLLRLQSHTCAPTPRQASIYLNLYWYLINLIVKYTFTYYICVFKPKKQYTKYILFYNWPVFTSSFQSNDLHRQSWQNIFSICSSTSWYLCN